MSWAITILAIMALIVLHELGHFTAAKAVGMRVERFSLFFGPMFVKVQRGETVYGIGVIPLGGYVKITGMSPEELEDAHPEVARRAYCNQTSWKRIVVILAGPAVNLVIAFLLFWAVLLGGSLNGAYTLESVNPSIHTRDPTTKVALIEKGQPAERALKVGDRIVTVDGRHASVDAAINAIGSHRCAGALRKGCRATTPVHLTVQRAGKALSLSIYPRYDATERRMLIGFGFGVKPKSYGPFAAAGTAAGEMWGITVRTLTHIGHAFTSSKTRHELHTIVGISEIADEAVEAGAGFALVVVGFISLVLAVVNLFPFLPLDGGHVAWALGEKLRGRRISVMAMWRYSSVGIVLFVFLFLNGLSNDISHLAG